MIRPGVARCATLAAAALLAAPGVGRGSDFFGTAQPLQLQPEVDLFQHFGGSFRLIVQVPATFIPESGGYTDVSVFAYGSVVVAPIFAELVRWASEPLPSPARQILHPDIAKNRKLELRAGGGYTATTAPGTLGWTRTLYATVEGTGRALLPGEILATLRNRFDGRWALDDGTRFSYRLRFRPQLEREFALSREARTALTPYVNAELIWSSTDDMWSQFRPQVGLQLTVHWFGRGQVLEANAAAFTNLQPARSTSPVIGFVFSQYLD